MEFFCGGFFLEIHILGTRPFCLVFIILLYSISIWLRFIIL